MIHLVVLAADPQPAPEGIGPGTWFQIVATAITTLITVIGVMLKARTWLNSAVRASDGRSLAQVVEQQSRTLDDLDGKVDRLASDVHELRGTQHGLADRVTRLETQVDDLIEPRRARRR